VVSVNADATGYGISFGNGDAMGLATDPRTAGPSRVVAIPEGSQPVPERFAWIWFPSLPTTEAQERYVTQLMRAKGYEFVSSQSFLWIGRQLTYRKNDAAD
jgi:hypothetical protein